MSAEEKKPLVEKEEAPPAAEPFYMKYAVPLAIGFYVFAYNASDALLLAQGSTQRCGDSHANDNKQMHDL